MNQQTASLPAVHPSPTSPIEQTRLKPALIEQIEKKLAGLMHGEIILCVSDGRVAFVRRTESERAA